MNKIALIDTQQLFRVSLKSHLQSYGNFEVAMEVASIKHIPKLIDLSKIEIVIYDPHEENINRLIEVRNKFPNARILILSHQIDRATVINYMDHGVAGYFSKNGCPTQLNSALNEIATNYDLREVRVGSLVRESLINSANFGNKKKINFTDRELQILNLVCLEKTNSEISTILNLSIRTVESHRRRMIDKTECKSIIGVVLNAIELQNINIGLIFNKSRQLI